MLAWDRLRVLASVADQGSIAAAAADLHLTGPGVSQHIRKLEVEAGRPLIERDGRGIRLTNAGHVLARHARRVAETVAAAERDLREFDDTVAGPLRIGAIGSALRAFLPPVLRELTNDHPGVDVTVSDGEGIDHLARLRRRDLDLVLLESWEIRPTVVPPGIRLRPLLTEDVAVALPSGHELAGADAVQMAQLEPMTWTTCAVGTDPYEALTQTMRREGLACRIEFFVADFSTQLELVATDMAVALVPRTAQRGAPDGVRFVPCDPPIRRTLAAATRTGNESHAVQDCVHRLQEYGAQMRAHT